MNLIEPGDRLLAVHRRLFEHDDNRLFVGEVESAEAGVIRVTGYSFVRDTLTGTVRRKSDARTKLLSLTSGTLIVYVLPPALQLDQVQIESEEAEMWLSDGNGFQMNLSEWTHRAH